MGEVEADLLEWEATAVCSGVEYGGEVALGWVGGRGRGGCIWGGGRVTVDGEPY
jgi:hypothetical protein